MGGSAVRGIMFSVKVNLLVLIACSTVVKSDMTRALLELSIRYTVSPIGKTNGHINYTIVVRQKERSTFDAVDIVVAVILPASVQYAGSTVLSRNESSYKINLYNKNRIDFVFGQLPLRSEVHFNFYAVITDKSLTSGLHYASTPIKLSYKTILTDNEITDEPFEIATVAQVPFFVAGCLQPMGISSGAIKFYQLSGSTTQVDLKPYKARNNGIDDAWCATAQDRRPYIQVVLPRLSRITGVSTWGRKLKALWVKKYTLEFSVDGEHWNAYGETGYLKQFEGNYDQSTEVQHWLIEPIVANYIRLCPIQWSVGVCMRFELYGCEISDKDNCMQPLGMENGQIPAASLSSLYPTLEDYPISTNFSRLNKIVDVFPHGWIADFSKEDWLQVDLGSSFRVTAVAVQGAWSNPNSYVKSFYLRYTNASRSYTITDANGKEKILPGAVGGFLPDMVHLGPAIIARYVRIIPLDSASLKVMRFELYGCLVEPHLRTKDTTIPLSRRSVLIDKKDNIIFVCIYTDDKTKSICKRSKDGKLWQSIDPNIMGIIHQKRVSRRLFAVNRDFHKAFSDNRGNTWYSISDNEWKRQTTDGDMSSLTNIENILPSVQPEGKLTWTTRNGNKWGVSGNGIHIMNRDATDWKLSAAWKCCGL